MKGRKLFVLLALLLSVVFITPLLTVHAATTEIQDILEPNSRVTTGGHGSYLTMTFKVKEGITDPMYEIRWSCSDITSTTPKYYPMTRNLEYEFKFKAKISGPIIIEIFVTSARYHGSVKIYLYSGTFIDSATTTSMNNSIRYNLETTLQEVVFDTEKYNDLVFENEDLTPDHKVYNNDYKRTYTDNITVEGYVKYTDKKTGDVIPARGVKVLVYDLEPLNKRKLLKTLYTDSNGRYIYNFSNDNGWFEKGYDIYVKVVFETSDFKVKDLYNTYSFDFEVHDNVDDGDHIGQSVTFKNPDDNFDRNTALQAHQATYTGFKYLDYVAPDNDKDLTVHYPSWISDTKFSDGCFYDLVGGIHLNSNMRKSSSYIWDTTIHEFGHFVAGQYLLTLFYPESHNFSQHQSDEFGKTIGTLLSWSEGFATYFGMRAQEMFAPSGIDYVKDGKHKAHDIESSTKYLLGESNEWVIARFLYDLADSVYGESWDKIYYGDKGLFSRLRGAAEDDTKGIATLSEFMEYMYETETKDFGPLLSYYNIAATPKIITLDEYKVPLFKWYAGGQDTSNNRTYDNNDFTIVVESTSGNVIFSQNVGNTTSSYVSEYNWNKVLSAGYTSVNWYVIAKQTDVIETGPYTSKKVTITIPSADPLYLETPITRNISYNGYEWHKFTASSSGYYTFYTTGYGDTYGEFFNKPATSDTTTNRFAYNDNGGDNFNFSKEIYLSAGRTIYIRVREADWDSCSYTLNSSYRPSSSSGGGGGGGGSILPIKVLM